MNSKIKTSNRINRLGCGTELLYCTRVYVNARVYGGAWIPMERFLNYVFWLLRGQKNHCKASWLYERRHHAANNKRVPQVQGGVTDDSSSHTSSETLR